MSNQPAVGVTGRRNAPIVVLAHMCSWLSAKEHGRFAETCKEWRRAAASRLSWGLSLDISQIGLCGAIQVRSVLARVPFVSLKLGKFSRQLGMLLTDFLCHVNCSKLQKVDFGDGCLDLFECHVIGRWRHLTELDLSKTSLGKTGGLENLKSLRVLKLPSLPSLDIQFLSGLPLSSLELRAARARNFNVLRSIHTLRSLRIESDSASDTSLAYLADLPNLSELCLTNLQCTGAFLCAFACAAQATQMIVKLQLDFMFELDGANLAYVSRLPLLRDLSLTWISLGTELVSPLHLRNALTNQLERLSLKSNDFGMEHIKELSMCTSLTDLSLSSPQLRASDFESLDLELKTLKLLDLRKCSRTSEPWVLRGDDWRNCSLDPATTQNLGQYFSLDPTYNQKLAQWFQKLPSSCQVLLSENVLFSAGRCAAP